MDGVHKLCKGPPILKCIIAISQLVWVLSLGKVGGCFAPVFSVSKVVSYIVPSKLKKQIISSTIQYQFFHPTLTHIATQQDHHKHIVLSPNKKANSDLSLWSVSVHEGLIADH